MAINILGTKQPDGCYLDADGVYYEDAEQFILTKVLDFCVCGDPESVLEYILKALDIIAWKQDETREVPFDVWYKQYKLRCELLFENSGAEYLMWYVLDSKGFTEHGSSVPGWLTAEGYALRDALREIVNSYEQPDTASQ